MKLKSILAAALIFAAPATSALSTTLYDGSVHTGSVTVRPSGSTPLGSFTAAANTLITHFSVNVDLNGTSDLNFIIFDQSNTLAYQSGTISDVVDNTGFEDILSPLINFTMLAGQVYRFGVASSTGGEYTFGGGSTTQNGITSSNNGNANGFLSPSFLSVASATMNVSLQGTAAPVPLPASLGFLTAGVFGFGVIRARRKS